MLYTEMSKDELTALRSDLDKKYNDFAAENTCPVKDLISDA